MKILPINVWDAIKVVLRERCIVLYAFVKKKKDSVCKHAGQDVRKRIVEKKTQRKQKERNKKGKNKLVKQKAKIKKEQRSQTKPKAISLKRLIN